MLLQVIAVLLGWTGLFGKLDILFLIGGFGVIIVDVLGVLSGKLKPFLPLILYVVGYIVLGSWRGILAGALVGNAMEVFTIVVGAIVAFFVSETIGKDPSASLEERHLTPLWVLGPVLTGYVLGIALVGFLIITNR
jgi:hypothetical protein